MSKPSSTAAVAPMTWVVIPDGDGLSLDSAAALARAPRSTRWSWRTLDGGRRVAATVKWLRYDATAPSRAGGFHTDIVADPVPPSHIITSRDAIDSVRETLHLLHREERTVPTVERASTVVGPDGAPLWRESGVRSVEALRERGFEAEAVVSFLAPEPARRAVYLDLDGLARVNRDVLRRMAPDLRLERLRAELPPPIAARDDAFVNDLWISLRPRLEMFSQVPRFLAYLSEDWTIPELSAEQGEEVATFAGRLCACPPITGREAVAWLDRLGGHAGDVARRRRLVRWCLTGQLVAPSLEAVWAHLGSKTAISRLEATIEKGRQEFSLEPRGKAR